MKLITVDAEKYRNRGDEFYRELYTQLKGVLIDKQFAAVANATAAEHGFAGCSPAAYASALRLNRYAPNAIMKKILLLMADDIVLPPTGHEIVDEMVDPNAAWFSLLPNGDKATHVFLANRMLDDADPMDVPEVGENDGYTCNTGRSRSHIGEVKIWIRSQYRDDLNRIREDLGITWQKMHAETLEMWRRRRMEQTGREDVELQQGAQDE